MFRVYYERAWIFITEYFNYIMIGCIKEGRAHEIKVSEERESKEENFNREMTKRRRWRKWITRKKRRKRRRKRKSLCLHLRKRLRLEPPSPLQSRKIAGRKAKVDPSAYRFEK